jgi:hypothetical protein
VVRSQRWRTGADLQIAERDDTKWFARGGWEWWRTGVGVGVALSPNVSPSALQDRWLLCCQCVSHSPRAPRSLLLLG